MLHVYNFVICEDKKQKVADYCARNWDWEGLGVCMLNVQRLNGRTH